jgi:hypothetical protein
LVATSTERRRSWPEEKEAADSVCDSGVLQPGRNARQRAQRTVEAVPALIAVLFL